VSTRTTTSRLHHLPLGSLRPFRREPLAFLAGVAARGDLSEFRLGRQRVFLLMNVEAIEEVLVSKNRFFLHDTQVRVEWLRRGRLPTPSRSLSGDHQTHLEQRRLLQPRFGKERVEEYVRVINEELERVASAWGICGEFELWTTMAELSLQVVARTVFRMERIDAARFVARTRDFLSVWSHVEPASTAILAPLRGDVRHAAGRYAEFDAELASMLDAGGNEELRAIFAADGGGYGLSAPADVRTIITAAQATGAAALTWTLYCLEQHPAQAARVRNELDDVLGGRAPTVTDFAPLRYTRAFAAEVLRLYAPVPFLGRRALVDVEIAGQRIPALTYLIVSPYLLHRDPRHFEQPELFRPERFIEQDYGAPRFIPFGIGPHRCIAERLIWTTQLLTLAAVAPRWRLHLRDGFVAAVRAGASLEPADDILVRPEQRRIAPPISERALLCWPAP
jgi:cytochrome P450